MTDHHLTAVRGAPHRRRASAGLRRAARPRAALAVAAGRAAQARTRAPVAQPGHVHRRGRGRVHDRARDHRPDAFAWLITVWLWLTVVFANLAEAVAEGRGKAQAETLRAARTDTVARQLEDWQPGGGRRRGDAVPARRPHQGDVVVVEAGETIPGDGDVVEGIASVDESAITGESAPVIRESGGDRVAVTGGTGAVRPDRRADHPEAGRELHRPDDRAGRGRQPAEDAERDRAEHPARRADDHLPARGGDPAAAGRSTPRPQQPGVPDTAASTATASPASCWSRCWSASSRPRSARCSRRSASPAWTGWCSATCWP